MLRFHIECFRDRVSSERVEQSPASTVPYRRSRLSANSGQACRHALNSRAYVRALLIALRLGDAELIQHCILSTPLAQVRIISP